MCQEKSKKRDCKTHLAKAPLCFGLLGVLCTRLLVLSVLFQVNRADVFLPSKQSLWSCLEDSLYSVFHFPSPPAFMLTT